jgi:ABC-type polar amino acid transport system ATPase subunit
VEAVSERVLDVRGVDISRGPRAVVQGASFRLDRRQILALMGASGSGKTTILRAIAGLDPIATGEITIDGLSIVPGRVLRGASRRELHRRVGMVFQFHHLFEHLTALHNVCLAPVHVLRRSRVEAERQARDLLDQMGVGARADALPHELSGGEAQRVAIARAMAMGPRVLLMDEPTASLDPARRGGLAATLTRLAADGCALVVASHDEEFVRSCAQRVLTIEAGRLIESSA